MLSYPRFNLNPIEIDQISIESIAVTFTTQSPTLSFQNETPVRKAVHAYLQVVIKRPKRNRCRASCRRRPADTHVCQHSRRSFLRIMLTVRVATPYRSAMLSKPANNSTKYDVLATSADQACDACRLLHTVLQSYTLESVGPAGIDFNPTAWYHSAFRVLQWRPEYDHRHDRQRPWGRPTSIYVFTTEGKLFQYETWTSID